jgi:methionyl aminopeptidase
MEKISIKTPAEIQIMKEGGKKLGQILDSALKIAKPGISTLEIDNFIDQEIVSFGGEASFKKVRDYNFASCVGINSEVVHSLPKKNKIIKKGDLLKIDLGMLWKGFHTDLSWTIEIETKKYEEFLKAGEIALLMAIKETKKGNRVGDISKTINENISKKGFSVVKVLTGHGIGKHLHEDPYIPGFFSGKMEKTPLLLSGMTLAIEVIYNEKSPEVVLENDDWTISTRDGKMSGLFERTIAVTDHGPLILTPTIIGKSELDGGLFV